MLFIFEISDMPRANTTGPKMYTCLTCPRRTRLKDRYSIPRKIKSLVIKCTGKTPGGKDSICSRCRFRFKCSLQRKDKVPVINQTATSSAQPDISSPPSVMLLFSSTLRGHSACCLCKRPGPKPVVVPVEMRHRLFLSHEVIIPAGSRCCPNHLQKNIEDVSLISATTTLNRYSITQMIRFLRSEVLRSEKIRLDFEKHSQLSDIDYLDLLGISKAAFDDMLTLD
ncbi:uncharacterized protein LOC134265287 [Saccostrea cucullata]|uniref:uncharacterized protein LOC134265287 n=1 Tax=Saccostrea cuccullata TaxID=36930 RepID=UPI002ED1A3ED